MTLAIDTRVAITGVSVFTPFGVGWEPLESALHEGRVAVEPAADQPEVGLAKVHDFDPQRHVTVRGMRVYPRASQLEICAAAVALADAGLTGDAALDAKDLGLVTASSHSHLETLIEYDRGLVTVGMQRTNPTLMPLGLPSAPGAATGLALPAKAFSITLNDGGASGLAALGLGARAIASGRARACIVAGAFTPFAELLRASFAAGTTSSAERFRVLDRDAAGVAFGEAAAALVLEPLEAALARGRTPLGVLRGEASRFAPPGASLASALERAISGVLGPNPQGLAPARPRVAPEQIRLACVGANGHPQDDAAHVEALSSALGAHADRVVLAAPKANLGESMDASGLIQAIVALGALRARRAPPIARLATPRTAGPIHPTRPSDLAPGAALLTAISPSRSCSALVLSLEPE
ncbi:MAG TPA: beta-ketoacyl synthase N-terminal-like domain-containing protein [Polyangiaceae bacterium]|nr:beta-ketoacyl synthase N-terminal-like domain-containing protein [Polyangiaceae bacterium]